MKSKCGCGSVGYCNCGVFKAKRKRYWKNNKYRRIKRKMIKGVITVKKRGEWE